MYQGMDKEVGHIRTSKSSSTAGLGKGRITLAREEYDKVRTGDSEEQTEE